MIMKGFAFLPTISLLFAGMMFSIMGHHAASAENLTREKVENQEDEQHYMLLVERDFLTTTSDELEEGREQSRDAPSLDEELRAILRQQQEDERRKLLEQDDIPASWSHNSKLLYHGEGIITMLRESDPCFKASKKGQGGKGKGKDKRRDLASSGGRRADHGADKKGPPSSGQHYVRRTLSNADHIGASLYDRTRSSDFLSAGAKSSKGSKSAKSSKKCGDDDLDGGDESEVPSSVPSLIPSSMPSKSSAPSNSKMPSSMPSKTPGLDGGDESEVPSAMPSSEPSSMPSKSSAPSSSKIPSSMPSKTPGPTSSQMPSSQPSDVPSEMPSTINEGICVARTYPESNYCNAGGGPTKPTFKPGFGYVNGQGCGSDADPAQTGANAGVPETNPDPDGFDPYCCSCCCTNQGGSFKCASNSCQVKQAGGGGGGGRMLEEDTPVSMLQW